MKTLFYLLLCAVSLLLLVYLIFPSPIAIINFEQLPESVVSSLSGDTEQVPNVKAFFSNNYRATVIPFYSLDYKSDTLFWFPPLRLNYPPEHAYTAIKDQTQSTYLEELFYPLRDSLFVNGLEPFEQDTKAPRYQGATMFVADDNNAYETKVTLRYYPSNYIARIIVWFGINVSLVLIYKLAKKEL